MKNLLKIILIAFTIIAGRFLLNSQHDNYVYASSTDNIIQSATTTSAAAVVDLVPDTDYTNLNSAVTIDINLNHLKGIAAEDITLLYDTTKLDVIGVTQVDGINVLYQDYSKDGQVRLIVASNGADNVINSDRTILKFSFKTVSGGKALIYVSKTKLADAIGNEIKLGGNQLGYAIVTINNTDTLDVNKDGSFTLGDLAIDANNIGKDPNESQFNIDVNGDGIVNILDLQLIYKDILKNTDYN